MQGPSGWLIVANKVIIEGTNGELLVYSGTPAFGNLIASIAGADFTDGLGNAGLEGIVSYIPATGTGGAYAAVLAEAGLLFYEAATEAGPWSEQAGIGPGGYGSGQLGFITQGGLGGGVIPQTGVPETTAGIYSALVAAGIFA